jgi:hypothetical protein
VLALCKYAGSAVSQQMMSSMEASCLTCERRVHIQCLCQCHAAGHMSRQGHQQGGADQHAAAPQVHVQHPHTPALLLLTGATATTGGSPAPQQRQLGGGVGAAGLELQGLAARQLDGGLQACEECKRLRSEHTEKALASRLDSQGG